jgi:hypothetical protein
MVLGSDLTVVVSVGCWVRMGEPYNGHSSSGSIPLTDPCIYSLYNLDVDCIRLLSLKVLLLLNNRQQS